MRPAMRLLEIFSCMNVLVYPSTHPHANAVRRCLFSVLAPHYLPQLISPDVLASSENPWQTACGLLVLLAAPDHHAGVRQYAETGGRILALGVNANRSQGLFGLHDNPSSFGSVGTGLGLVKDTTILRLVDNKASLHLSFPSQASSPAIVNHDEKKIAITRMPSSSLDLGEGVRVLGRYADGETLAGALSESGAIALWSCAPPLPEQLLILTLSALGLQFNLSNSADGQQQHGLNILPQLLLAHPKKSDAWLHIVHALFPNRDLETAFSTLIVKDGTRKVTAIESVVFPDQRDTFQFHFVRTVPPVDLSSDHPIRNLLSGASKEEIKDVILSPLPLTVEQERHYTPCFSPSTFFAMLDEFRPIRKTDELLVGDVLLYGEVVTSTQTMLDGNPNLLRALPSPLLSIATKQVAGRGRGKNAWLSPAGSMLMSLKLTVPLKRVDSDYDSCSIRPSNLVFVQYLFALAVVEACQALDPAKGWATKVKLKWPNDIYGEFSGSTRKGIELKKLGGILVNTSFQGSTADVIIGCGLNILNEPPIGSLAQLEALTRGQATSSTLTIERVTAAVLTTFERMWNLFLAEESEGFRPFMDRYTDSWLHSDQIVTLTTTTPHVTVRIVDITPDHGLLRTQPLGGGQYIDLQPDGNSFDMMKGLIKTKTN